MKRTDSSLADFWRGVEIIQRNIDADDWFAVDEILWRAFRKAQEVYGCNATPKFREHLKFYNTLVKEGT